MVVLGEIGEIWLRNSQVGGRAGRQPVRQSVRVYHNTTIPNTHSSPEEQQGIEALIRMKQPCCPGMNNIDGSIFISASVR